MYINSNIIQSSILSVIKNIDMRSQLEGQIQNQEVKDSGWRLVKFNSMTNVFYKTSESNGSRSIKTPIRSLTVINDKNDDKKSVFLVKISAH